MICKGCNNEEAYRISGTGKWIDELKRYDEWCNKCGDLTGVWLPDVCNVRGSYYDESLNTVIHSRRHKAQILRERGYVECGDRKLPQTGKPMPHIKDPVARKRYIRDNFGC